MLQLEEKSSDHSPIMLDLSPSSSRKCRRFKFQERWCLLEEARQVILEAWNVEVIGSPMFKLFHKLKHCCHTLVSWQRYSESNSQKKINDLKQELATSRDHGEEG